MGYPRPDGSAGIRNHILVIGTDLQGFSTGQKAAALVKEALLLLFRRENEEGLINAVRHPNAAGFIVVGEELEDDAATDLVSHLERTGKPHSTVRVKGSDPVRALSKTLRAVTGIVRDVSTQRRELTRLSKLVPALLFSGTGALPGPLEGFVQSLLEENGRCLFVDRAGGKAGALEPYIRKNLKATLKPGRNAGPDPGIYRCPYPGKTDELWNTMLTCGSQMLIHQADSGARVCHPLMPVLNLIVDGNDEPKGLCDLDLSPSSRGELEAGDLGLLLLNETLATASGKLTGCEIPGDRVLPL